jgi:ATP-dependent helicase YprA (DUF1998 family)
MLPPLVAQDVRRTLTDFLGTTFALTDDDVRQALRTFLLDPAAGIFRGPFLRVRLPFRPGDDAWREHVAWAPAGFAPYHHQAQAFARLGSLTGDPRPTIVTTGTGSGKTESFLVPVLDHCRRERAAGRRGVKALLLYPMNALANDQARRIAQYVHTDPALAGIRAGLYVGHNGTHTAMGADHLVDDRATLRNDPPDILLTNYKMLDHLLLRPEDRQLWASAGETLRYLVLDEFHTYDGAQGTDVAMLLRRLGATLDIAEPGRPLGRVTPVGTSATLGAGPGATEALLDFAAEVFGCSFPADAVVGEDRLRADEWLHPVPAQAGGAEAGIPVFSDARRSYDEVTVAGTTPHDDLVCLAAEVFLTPTVVEAVGDSEFALGDALRAHPLTHRIVQHAADPVPLDDLLDRVLPSWNLRGESARDRARNLLSGYLGLVARARAGTRESPQPLVQLDVQLWVREVSRLLRRVSAEPHLQWGDDPPGAGDVLLPAVYCRHCGRSGLGAVRRTAGSALELEPKRVWRDPVTDRSRLVALIHAPGEAAALASRVGAGDDEVGGDAGAALRWFVPGRATLDTRRPTGDEDAVPVLPPVDADAARRDRCPACGQDEGIRFLGSRVATLVSVALGHLFASPDIDDRSKKTLVFTDSVQDAAHRAAFVEARAYALNLRSAMAAAVDRPVPLDTLGRRLAEAAAARSPGDRYALLPPDLQHHRRFARFWDDDTLDPATVDVVARRLQLSAVLEFGLQSRTGRTLELTGTVAVDVMWPSRAVVVRDLRRALSDLPRQGAFDVAVAPPAGAPEDPDDRLWTWAVGAVERIRTLGGVDHGYFTEYLRSGGRRWSIWGGRNREEGMPAFPSGRPAPSYPRSGARTGDDEAFEIIGSTRGWWAGWARRCLGAVPPDTPALSRALLDVLTRHHVLEARDITGGATVWLLRPDRIRLLPVPDDALAGGQAMLRCDACAERRPGLGTAHDALDGAPCLRAACPGRYRAPAEAEDYYRSLYRAGSVRRIVAREHTSLLTDEARARLEDDFKQPRSADAPNVLTCTPTLELGIDIGDLSVVALTSLPKRTASYLQRVGRAGRRTGNALVVSVLPGRALELQRLADPMSMLAGEVAPPATHLDATEILQRQYLAFVLDRAARAGRPAPRTIEQALVLGEGGWLPGILREARENAEALVAEFVGLFGERLQPDTVEALQTWAGVGAPGESALTAAVHEAAGRWRAEQEQRRERRDELRKEYARLGALGDALDEEGKADRRRVGGEIRRADDALREARDDHWIGGLEKLGLLPNYDLIGDGTKLDVTLWWTDEESGAADHTSDSYVRGSAAALRELAPGAVFYVRGSAIHIDAVDVGPPGHETVVEWRICPSCGWSGRDQGALPCPRCGDGRAAEVGQRLPVLEFRGASAYEARDQAVTGDDRDDREITRFVVAAGVDVDPGDVAGAWRLKDRPFGVEFARRAVVRWLNLGVDRTGGATRRLHGEDLQVPLFRACRTCGIVPAAQRDRAGRRLPSPQDARHRGWCRQRRMYDPEGWVDVALSHELRTQVLRLLIPRIDLVDPRRQESFRAALLLGLREILGGDPDHLDALVSPLAGSGAGDQRHVLVLHDTVPGGTGYLAQIASPQQVHRLLTAARDRLADCPCAEEPVAACHRCLLAHVPATRADQVDRLLAVDMLTRTLEHWEPTVVPSLLAAIDSGESPLEVRFRQALRQWLDSRRIGVSESSGLANDWRFRLPGHRGGPDHVWTMTPQAQLGYVQPDFVLASPSSAHRVAVFLDGAAFHSSPANNRIGDDAGKRARLRDDGFLVWAVTGEDLDAFTSGQPSWDQVVVPAPAQGGPMGAVPATLRPKFEAAAVRLSGGVPGGSVPAAALTGDAMTGLLRFLQRPEPDAWRAPALALALSFGVDAGTTGTGTREEVVARAAAVAVGDVVQGDGRRWGQTVGDGPVVPYRVGRSAHGAAVAVLRAGPGTTDAEVVLCVDDRDATVGTPDQIEAWRDWLWLGNLLQLARETVSDLVAVSVSVADAAPAALGGAGDSPVQAHLAELLAAVDEIWHCLVRRLTPAGAAAAEPGFETDDGVPLCLAWPDRGIALRDEDDEDVTAWLTAKGWAWASTPGPDADDLLSRHGLLVGASSGEG